MENTQKYIFIDMSFSLQSYIMDRSSDASTYVSNEIECIKEVRIPNVISINKFLYVMENVKYEITPSGELIKTFPYNTSKYDSDLLNRSKTEYYTLSILKGNLRFEQLIKYSLNSERAVIIKEYIQYGNLFNFKSILQSNL